MSLIESEEIIIKKKNKKKGEIGRRMLSRRNVSPW